MFNERFKELGTNENDLIRDLSKSCPRMKNRKNFIYFAFKIFITDNKIIKLVDLGEVRYVTKLHVVIKLVN